MDPSHRALSARHRLASLGAIAILLAACGSDATPSTSPGPAASTPGVTRSIAPPPDPAAVLLANIMGPFRPKFVPVAEEIAATVREACVAAADPIRSFGLTDQPVVLADARGLGLVTIILAGDDAAFECRARLADGGKTAAAIEPPARLDPAAAAALDGDAISRVSQTVNEDPTGQRTVAFGRVGPEGPAVGVTFNDETEVVAVVANGWWAAWWPGVKEPGGIVSANMRNEVQNHVPEPTRLVEGRVTPAAWWIDAAPQAAATTVRASVRERACAGGESPKRRIRAPTIVEGASKLVITVWIARRPGDQDCPGSQAVPLTIELGARVGARTLLDGGETPPRDATVRPG